MDQIMAIEVCLVMVIDDEKVLCPPGNVFYITTCQIRKHGHIILIIGYFLQCFWVKLPDYLHFYLLPLRKKAPE